MSEDALYIGVNLPAKQGISNPQIVDDALHRGYDLITSRITSSIYRKRVQSLYAEPNVDPSVPVPIGEDLVVFPGSHVSNTIALCAPWAELDSKDARIADLSLQVLLHELAYAKFCGLPYVVIEGPVRRTHLARYAHSLAKLLNQFPEIKIMLHTTFSEDFRDGVPPLDLLSTWDVWDGVRTLCGHPTNLGLTLEVQNARLPEFVISRWLCEPVMMLILSELSTFVPNPKNYPVLPRHTQSLVRRFSLRHPFFLIKEHTGKPLNFSGGEGAAQIYLRNLLKLPNLRFSHASQPSSSSHNVDPEPTRPQSIGSDTSDVQVSCFCRQYADVLETPLQPLSSALNSAVYGVFETDETKYNQYYRAIASALTSIVHSGYLTDDGITIAVLGAGQGALVDRVMDAVVSQRITCKVTVYAVEKHAGPVAYLQARKTSEPVWETVQIVYTDMRDWVPLRPCQLIVSELLGSFGDNELSPECLGKLSDNPQVLDQRTGMIIPCSYTSYIAPLYSPQLWVKARSFHRARKVSLEQPYVVCLHQAELLAEPVPVWTFEHRRGVANLSNKRSAKANFRVARRSRVYGFAGYFEATLVPGITLSTVPSAPTPNLISWFPLVFPVKEPLDVYPEGSMDISIWRETNQQRCWYEWAVETSLRRARFGLSTIHNCGGHAQSMPLF